MRPTARKPCHSAGDSIEIGRHLVPRDEAVNSALATSYFAKGSGRTWNFTIFGRAPLPPSWCQGVYIE